MRRGRRTGSTVAIAIHDLVGGRAFGPLRVWGYGEVEEAIDDALRLARDASDSARIAAADAGGGAAVVCIRGTEPAGEWARIELMHDLGEMIDSLQGRFSGFRDVGVSEGDMVSLAGPTVHLSGLPRRLGGAGNPALITALGTEHALRSAASHRLGPIGLARLRIAVVGLGAVGAALARKLAATGCDLVVSDIDPQLELFAGEIGARWVEPFDAPFVDCDILVPCAPGIRLRPGECAGLRTRVVCGPAADFLADSDVTPDPASEEILFVPPQVVGAGAMILAAAEARRLGRSEAIAQAIALGGRVSELLTRARRLGISPTDALAEERPNLPEADSVKASPATLPR